MKYKKEIVIFVVVFILTMLFGIISGIADTLLYWLFSLIQSVIFIVVFKIWWDTSDNRIFEVIMILGISIMSGITTFVIMDNIIFASKEYVTVTESGEVKVFESCYISSNEEEGNICFSETGEKETVKDVVKVKDKAFPYSLYSKYNYGALMENGEIKKFRVCGTIGEYKICRSENKGMEFVDDYWRRIKGSIISDALNNKSYIVKLKTGEIKKIDVCYDTGEHKICNTDSGDVVVEDFWENRYRSKYLVLMDDETIKASDSCYEKNGNKVCEINDQKLVVEDYWDSKIEKEDGCEALLSDGTVEESDSCYERNGHKICRVFGNRFGETIVVEDYWKLDDSNDD